MKQHSPSAPLSSTASFARLLSGLYILFAISAGVRALYQLAVKFQQAPLAYTLSTIAALVYLIAVLVLRHRSPRAWRITFAVCLFELIGVLTVGTLTVIQPQLFAAQTVWSVYGQGYGYIPLILPIMGLAWLLRPHVRQEYGISSELRA